MTFDILGITVPSNFESSILALLGHLKVMAKAEDAFAKAALVGNGREVVYTGKIEKPAPAGVVQHTAGRARAEGRDG